MKVLTASDIDFHRSPPAFPTAVTPFTSGFSSLNVFLNSFLYPHHSAIHPSLFTSLKTTKKKATQKITACNNHHRHSQKDEERGRWPLRGIRVLHFLGGLWLLSLGLLHGPFPLLDVPATNTHLDIVRSTLSSFRYRERL